MSDSTEELHSTITDLESEKTGIENKSYHHNEIEIPEIPNLDLQKGKASNELPTISGFVSPNSKAGSENGDDGDEEQRDQWSNPIEFLLSCIAMSVGLGNIWRFPFTAYENGGGAFLIPYLIVLFFIGKPVYYLELAMGQFSSYGQVKVWRLSPLFKGLGYAQMMATICTFSYYTYLMALTVFYFFSSFAKTLPWGDCNDDWTGELYRCNGSDKVVWKHNGSEAPVSVPELYFVNHVLEEKANVEDGIGVPDLRLAGCLLFAWTCICLAIIKGVQSSGKVAYFTALFPYVVLLILLIRGCTMTGAWKGIKFFIEPQWEKLYDAKVWYEAVKQCFFSLNTGFGSIVMFSSFNPFRHNIYRDAWIISLMDTFTSLLAGFTIFAILGSLATSLNVEVSDVANGGPGLAFVSYPQALAQFDWAPQLFAVIFFLMLFTLGVGSGTALVGSVITIVCDQWNNLPRWQVTIVACTCGFLVSLLYTTPGGLFMLTLIDHFGATFVIYIIVMVEVFTISWVYGLKNFCNDIEFMLGIKVGIYWKICWGYFVPIALLVIFIYNMVTQDKLTHNGVEYPNIAYVVGWLLTAVVLLVIPVAGLHSMNHIGSGSLRERFLAAMKPKKTWGPKNKKDKRDWLAYKAKAH